MLLDAVDGHEVRQFEDVRGTGTVRKLAFRPNGSTLAAHQTRSSVIVWDPVSGCEVTLLETFGATAALLAFSPDGSALATLQRPDNVIVRDAITGRQLWQLARVSSRQIRRLALGTRGRLVAAASNDGKVTLWDVAVGRELRLRPLLPDAVREIGPDEDLLRITSTGY